METAAELSFLTLGVRDLARARRFLELALGFEPLPSRSGLVLFRSGSLTLALHPRADLARETGWPRAAPPASGALASAAGGPPTTASVPPADIRAPLARTERAEPR